MSRPRPYDFSRLEERKAFYRSARWRKTRRLKLAMDPWCEECSESWGRTVEAREVDHVLELKDRPDLALVIENLRSLCPACHLEKRGER